VTVFHWRKIVIYSGIKTVVTFLDISSSDAVVQCGRVLGISVILIRLCCCVLGNSVIFETEELQAIEFASLSTQNVPLTTSQSGLTIVTSSITQQASSLQLKTQVSDEQSTGFVFIMTIIIIIILTTTVLSLLLLMTMRRRKLQYIMQLVIKLEIQPHSTCLHWIPVRQLIVFKTAMLVYWRFHT